MRFLILAAAAAIATVQAVRHDHIATDLARAVAPRDDSCSEPKLCTGGVMMYGYATTLTYLCPEETEPATTIAKVTSTKLVTVTVELKGSAPPQVAPAQEPTTTTKTTTTVTEDRFVTVHGRANPGTSLTPPVITDWFSQGTPPPTLTPPVITTSFSEGIPPKKTAGVINKGADPPQSLTPPVITDWFSQGEPPKAEATSLTPPVITDWFSQGEPPKAKVPTLTPPVITDWFSQGEPPKAKATTLTPPVITDWFSQGEPPVVQTGFRVVKHENHTTSTNATHTNTTHLVPTPTGMAGQMGVSVGALVLGLVAAACFV